MARFKWLAAPYFLWLMLLVVSPVLVMLVMTFFSLDGMAFSKAVFSFDSYARMADPAIYRALGNSLLVAFWTAVLCFFLGYPVAYIISFSQLRNKLPVLLAMILPMWSNSMLRIVSWLRLFSVDAFAAWGLLGSMEAVIFVSVTTYLPFMIFPIYTVLEKMDRSLLEASSDLGVPAWKTFLKVTFPLSLGGVSSGVLMVFLPAATGFAISQTIGQGKVRLIGNLLQSVFEKNNYSYGSLLSIFVSLCVLALILALSALAALGRHGKRRFALARLGKGGKRPC